MPTDIHAFAVPAFLRGLSILAGLLRKAEAHATERKIDPSVLLAARLFPDMFPLTRQVQTACDTAKRAIGRLAALEPPPFEDTESSFEELYARIEKTCEVVAALGEGGLEGAGERTIEIKLGGAAISMSGVDYLTRFALPNFYFHLTTSYDILRHSGVALAKRDFLGNLAS